jgi:hypothetical protein
MSDLYTAWSESEFELGTSCHSRPQGFRAGGRRGATAHHPGDASAWRPAAHRSGPEQPLRGGLRHDEGGAPDPRQRGAGQHHEEGGNGGSFAAIPKASSHVVQSLTGTIALVTASKAVSVSELLEARLYLIVSPTPPSELSTRRCPTPSPPSAA